MANDFCIFYFKIFIYNYRIINLSFFYSWAIIQKLQLLLKTKNSVYSIPGLTMLCGRKQKAMNSLRLLFPLNLQNNMMIGKITLKKAQLPILSGLYILQSMSIKKQACAEIVELQQYLFIYF